ncbi:SMP-30/gluconolactonase/LRE family protein [Verrucomicrobia bacterium]|nr:SMP-30/gluconolactonase/LRE family protein [Verrucomicrobiota bacterium]
MTKNLIAIVWTIFLALSCYADPYDGWKVSTFAGTGVAGYSGDGGPATEGKINNPFGVLRGPDGDIYFCEYDGHRIRKVDSMGNLQTVAGKGAEGYSGDGGPATEAKLNKPHELRFSRYGNLFFTDMANHVVRKVDMETGIITTVVGTGKAGFYGDDKEANKAKLNKPHSLQFGPKGRLFICDTGNHRVRVVDMKTGIIRTLSGTGKREFTKDGAPFKGQPLNGPRTMDFDLMGNLWLALREGNQVFKLDMKRGTIHHVAGTGKKGMTGNGGLAKYATLAGPKGICVAKNGDVLLADTESHTIRVVVASTGMIHQVCGTGSQANGPDGDPLKCGLGRPHGVWIDDDGAIWIGDSLSHRIRVLRPQG